MAKFIIEVTDDYIRERANVDNIMQLSKQEDANPLALMCNMIVFGHLKDEVDKGNNEFHLSSLDMTDDDLKIFNNVVRDCGAIIIKTTANK